MTGEGAADGARRSWAYLSRVAEPPCAPLVELVAAEGPVRAAERVRRGAVPAPVLRATVARRDHDQAAADLAAAAASGARLLTPDDDHWPRWALLALRGGPDALVAPLALWVRGAGRLDELAERSVAVVGTRAATGYGDLVAAEFGAELAEAGFTVVSGAAFGIDAAAHRGCLAAGGPTVAVLACGIDRAYPAAHTGLLGRIAEAGLVVSEYPPGVPPGRHRFLARNRLIAALGQGAVVVEAGVRSGTRNTAAAARLQGRVVMAVPGPVTSATSVGCNAMLRGAEALAVTSAADVVESVGRLGADLVAAPRAPVLPTDGLDTDQLRVHEALPPIGARAAGWLAVESGVALERVRSVLPELELRGLARCGEDGWSRSPTGGRGRGAG